MRHLLTFANIYKMTRNLFCYLLTNTGQVGGKWGEGEGGGAGETGMGEKAAAEEVWI